ncbi:MAG TPA: glycosyltransferase [Candidatus Eisenbergiella stercoravium]|nr:glycosyltransferase [Candidatus Eisenbergiella stercoravium]
MEHNTSPKSQSGQKHIVLFISALRKGGAERVMVNLADYLHRNGVRVTLVTQYICEEEYTLPAGIPRILSEITPQEETGSRIGDFLARYRKLCRIFTELHPDCILSFIGKNNIMTLLCTRFSGIPAVVSVRGEPKSEYYNFPMRFLAKTLFACAAGVIVQTSAARDFFPPVIRKKAVILKNPLNPAFVRERRTGRPDGRIVSVGRVDANKNHALILRAFARIAPEFPNASLVVYGDGEKRQELIRKTQELGLSDRVQFPGAVSDVAEKIRTASAFVLSSGHEGMPNALIEAMCLGIPSISTDCPCGGPRELIEDGVNGYLIPVGDEEALADRLRRIFSDEEGAERMGKQAALLLEEYRPERVNAEWMDYLLGCAAR